MNDLIERLKAATEGTVHLDIAIGRAAGWPGGIGLAMGYSRSLDVAVTLVPSDCVYTVGTDFELPGYARLWRGPVTVDDRPQRWDAEAATPALALCIAALMAREAG